MLLHNIKNDLLNVFNGGGNLEQPKCDIFAINLKY